MGFWGVSGFREVLWHKCSNKEASKMALELIVVQASKPKANILRFVWSLLGPHIHLKQVNGVQGLGFSV